LRKLEKTSAQRFPLYTPRGKTYKSTMKHSEWLIFWLVGLLILGGWSLFILLSRSARLRRRRRKSHGRIQSTSNRPAVRFSVRSPKK